MLLVNDAAVDGRAIGVDIEDRQKNSDTARFHFESFILIHLNDVCNRSVGRSDD